MIDRFDHVAYDGYARETQAMFKQLFTAVSQMVEDNCSAARASSLAQAKLEEAYMWVGKAIRDDQISRNYETKLEENRRNS